MKELIDAVSGFYPGIPPITKKDKVEMVEGDIILVEGVPSFFINQDMKLPLLKNILIHPVLLPQVAVDMGAIRFVTSGADVMRPGIVRIDDGVEKDGPVLIVDESHGKPLALGKALYGAQEMRPMEKGKVVVVLHHVGDSLWNITL